MVPSNCTETPTKTQLDHVPEIAPVTVTTAGR